MSVFMQPIYTQTVGAGAGNTVTFNNIPQGFSDLKLVINSRSTLATNNSSYMGLYLNGDTSPVYSYTKIYGTGSGVGTYHIGGNTNVGGMVAPAAGATANTFGNAEIYFPNYSGGNFKSFSMDSIPETNASTFSYDGLELTACLYGSTKPITSISVFIDTGFAQYSTLTLYGISEQYASQTATAPTIGTVTDQAGFASVAFTPAANDQAQLYKVVNGVDSTATYGSVSPIVAPATVGTSTTYTVQAVNDKGSAASSASSAITTANAYSSIATFALGSATSSVTFSNIPQNYTHLQIRAFTRSTVSQSGSIYNVFFNGDNAGNYSNHQLNADGSSAFSSGSTNQTAIQLRDTTGASNTANAFGVALIDILDYTNTNKYKTLRYIGGYDSNGSGLVGMDSGAWFNFAPITTINISTYANFAQYSHFALYGIA
jgi:hypothetical protein